MVWSWGLGLLRLAVKQWFTWVGLMSTPGSLRGIVLREWTDVVDGRHHEIMVFFAGRGLWGRLFFFARRVLNAISGEMFHVEHMMAVNVRPCPSCPTAARRRGT